MSELEKFDQWAIIELFGRQRIAGKVTEANIGGCSFVRVDVPRSPERQEFTKLYGNGAIYAITITDEKTARAAAMSFQARPMDEFTISDLRQIANTPEDMFGEGQEDGEYGELYD